MNGETVCPLSSSTVDHHAQLARLVGGHFREVWNWLAALGVPPSELRDTTVEVFAMVWNEIESLPTTPSLRTWLFSRTVEVARCRETHAFVTQPDAETMAPLARFLAPLTERERVVFLLFELGGLPLEQIAELTNEPLSRLFEQLHRARSEESLGMRSPADPLRRLLSPTVRISQTLRAALQAALPVLPTRCDVEAVEHALLELASSSEFGERRSGILHKSEDLHSLPSTRT
jgi:DNA-directed RNA polymerase specialized sigma24 family protein